MRLRRLLFILVSLALGATWLHASQHTFAVKGDRTLFDGVPFKVVGVRCSNALISDATTQKLIDNLESFQSCGVNTVSVYLMGSRFGDVKGYRLDATLDPVYAARLGRIIEAADARGIIVLVGCLYWSDSKAKENLEKVWVQKDANQAVANTVRWLKEHNYRNVFVDPDNEGMAHRGAKFDIARMIDSAHAVDPAIMVAWNDKDKPSDNADLLIHHSPKVKGRVWIQTEGTPNNAPGGYWGDYSKRQGLYDYINIGVYSEAMRTDNIRQTEEAMRDWNGYILASTWLQCPPPSGPRQSPGGYGDPDEPGVRWWLDYVRDHFGGAWTPPNKTNAADVTKTATAATSASTSPVTATPTPATRVMQWDRFDREIENPKRYADPFRDVTLDVIWTREDGLRQAFWGFYDGGDTWRIRFMPDRPGRWRYEARFSDSTPGASGAIECTTSSIPGLLGPHPDNPLWFAAKNGKPFQLRGFHCGDRFFALNWPVESRRAFLDWAGAQGYNMISVASHYLNRRAPGRGEGWETPALWRGGNQSRPDPAEYQRLELMLDDLANRGIYVHPFAGFFGQMSAFPQRRADQELYVRYTLARLGPYWNMLFNVAGPEPIGHEADFYNAMSFETVNRLGRLIRRLDRFDHPLSVHNATGDDPFLGQGWESYVTLQGWKNRDWSAIAKGMQRNHANKPVLAHEVFWPGNTLGHGEFTDDDIRKKAYVLLMSAVAINFADMKGNSSSGFSGSLDLKDKIQQRHAIVKEVWDYFETFPFYKMSPRPELVNRGFCLAEEGKRYLVYLPEGGKVDVKVTTGTYRMAWINPRNTLQRKTENPTRDGKGLAAPDAKNDWLAELAK